MGQTAFSNEVASLVDEGWAVDVIYIYFSNAFDTAFHGILRDKACVR